MNSLVKGLSVAFKLLDRILLKIDFRFSKTRSRSWPSDIFRLFSKPHLTYNLALHSLVVQPFMEVVCWHEEFLVDFTVHISDVISG